MIWGRLASRKKGGELVELSVMLAICSIRRPAWITKRGEGAMKGRYIQKLVTMEGAHLDVITIKVVAVVAASD
jgi:hypothetical protein